MLQYSPDKVCNRAIEYRSVTSRKFYLVILALNSEKAA